SYTHRAYAPFFVPPLRPPPRPPSSPSPPLSRSASPHGQRQPGRRRPPGTPASIPPAADGRRARARRHARASDQRGLVGEPRRPRSEEHTSELQSRENLVCRLLLEKKKKDIQPSP